MDVQHQYRTIYESPLNWPTGTYTSTDAPAPLSQSVSDFLQACVPGMPVNNWFLDVDQNAQRIEFEPTLLRLQPLNRGTLLAPLPCACCAPVPVQWRLTWNAERQLYRLERN